MERCIPIYNCVACRINLKFRVIIIFFWFIILHLFFLWIKYDPGGEVDVDHNAKILQFIWRKYQETFGIKERKSKKKRKLSCCVLKYIIKFIKIKVYFINKEITNTWEKQNRKFRNTDVLAQYLQINSVIYAWDKWC